MADIKTFQVLKEQIYNIIPVGYERISIMSETEFDISVEIGSAIVTVYSDMDFCIVDTGIKPYMKKAEDWDNLYRMFEIRISREKTWGDRKKASIEKMKILSGLKELLEQTPQYLVLKEKVQKTLNSESAYVKHFMPKENDHEDWKDDDGKIRVSNIRRTPERQEREGIEALFEDKDGYFSEYVFEVLGDEVDSLMRFIIKELMYA